MNNAVVLDTTFLISLVDQNRPCHETAKRYYRYFLEKQIIMMLPTIVAAEFAIQQAITDLPLHNFRVLPFNLIDAQCCGNLNAFYYRTLVGVGKRDAVKDDFKIIAQAVDQKAGFLITEDEETLRCYCEKLRQEGKVQFKSISLKQGFDESLLSQDGQRLLNIPE